MALNIKNAEAERLAAEVAGLSNSSLTQAVIQALRARRDMLVNQRRRERGVEQARQFLAREFWKRSRPRKTMKEDALLGYGESGA